MTSIRSLPVLANESTQPLLPIQSIPQKQKKQAIQAPFGNPRRSRRAEENYHNVRLEQGLTFCGYHEIAKLLPIDAQPEQLVAASEMRNHLHKRPETKWIHFYEDDSKLRRFWRNPDKYRLIISQFAGIIGFDFSVYRNMRRSYAISNTDRNYLLTAHMQQHWGVNAIANVRLQGPDSVSWALAGVPEHSTLAIASHGCLQADNKASFAEEVRIIVDAKQPLRIVCYGAQSTVFDYALEQGVDVVCFKPDTRERSKERHRA